MQSDLAEPVVLVVATLDTKHREAGYLTERIESLGCRTLLMDTGVFAAPADRLRDLMVTVSREEVARAAGATIEELDQCGDKGRCIRTMAEGAQNVAQKLHAQGRYDGIIGIGGAQGTDISTRVMRALPFGLPKIMVSAVATGTAQFGPFVGTKDILMMHSVADIQGLNFVTARVLSNAAAAICGMVKNGHDVACRDTEEHTVALSMSGTTTPGALIAMSRLEKAGLAAVAFHQNGSGGIAMEDMISEGLFAGVLDCNLHEIGDSIVAGLHGATKEYRLESAGRIGIPQVVAPGSINYTVQGPLATLSDEMRRRKLIVHNSYLTLVRLSNEELKKAARVVASKLNGASGPVHFFVPLRGFSFPDREGLAHWDPDGNRVFVETLKEELKPSIPLTEIDAHINDPGFIDPMVDDFIALVRAYPQERRLPGDQLQGEQTST